MKERPLSSDSVACADKESCMTACESKVGCSNTAYAALVMEILPLGKFYFVQNCNSHKEENLKAR